MKVDINLSPLIAFGSDQLPTGNSTSQSRLQRAEGETTLPAENKQQREAEFELRDLLDRIIYDDEHPIVGLLPRVEQLFDTYGVRLLDALRQIMEAGPIVPSWKLGELLALIGQVKHESTRDARLYMLICSLLDPRVAVRDGAISGLAFLQPRNNVKHLQYALKRETREDLKISLKKLIAWLQR